MTSFSDVTSGNHFRALLTKSKPICIYDKRTCGTIDEAGINNNKKPSPAQLSSLISSTWIVARGPNRNLKSWSIHFLSSLTSKAFCINGMVPDTAMRASQIAIWKQKVFYRVHRSTTNRAQGKKPEVHPTQRGENLVSRAQTYKTLIS